MQLFKVTRIEIWQVQDSEQLGEPFASTDLHDAVQDAMLNSQDNPYYTDDMFEVTPKQIVELKIEELCGCGGPKNHKGDCDNWMSEQEGR